MLNGAERQFATELDDKLSSKDTRWINTSKDVNFYTDEKGYIKIDDEGMIEDFYADLKIVMSEAIKVNEVIEEINRERNQDYALDNMPCDDEMVIDDISQIYDPKETENE